MAGTLASLTIRVGTEAKDAIRGLSTLDKRVQQTKRKFTTLESSTLSLRKAFGVLAGATGAAFVANKVLQMGANVEETANKFNKVMGPAAEDMRGRLEDLTETIPLMRSEMEGLAARTQDMLVPMGLAREEAAGMSVDFVKLAGDIASFNNISAGEAMQAISSGLAGESEPLRRYGVDVRQAALETVALEEGLIKAGEELDATSRAAAVFLKVQQDSADAMGDAADTAGSAANQLRFLKRDAKQLAEDFSVALTPALTQFVGAGGDGLSTLEGIGDELKSQAPVIAAWARFAVEAGKFAAQAFAAPLRIAFNLGQVFARVSGAFVRMTQGDLAGAREMLGQVAADFVDMNSVATGLIDGFDGMREAAGRAFETMPKLIRDTANEMEKLNRAVSGEGGAGGVAPNLGLATSELQNMVALKGKVDDLQISIAGAADEAGEISREANQFRQVFGSAAAQAGLDFKEFADLVISQLKRIAIQKAALKLFDIAFPGAGTAFAGLFQHGGFIPRGQFGIAGEVGPEIVHGPARVISTEQTGRMMRGGGGSGAVASQILAAVGPHPGSVPPSTAATDAWWREVFRRLDDDNNERS